MKKRLLSLKHIIDVAIKHHNAPHDIERFNEELSPNVRALRLAVSIADTLVALGVAVSDVVSMGLDVTDRYCERKVQFDISYTLIMASQDRGNDREPLTMIRHSQPRTPNNMLVQSIQELVRDISRGNVPLEEAEKRLDEILIKPQKYPYWLTTIGSALISSGVAVMFGASTQIIFLVFIIGALVSYILRVLAHHRVPSFFAQVFASIFITLMAAAISALGEFQALTFFHNIDPTLIVIGGIVMLVAGLAIVSAVQDAIDEYYITANARLLRVGMMTIGIVVGVVIGLYVADQLGTAIAVNSAGPPLARGNWQLAGAVIISIGYAMSMQSKLASVLISGAIGALGWIVYMSVDLGQSLSAVVASGVAAIVVGVAGTLISRIVRTPSAGLIMAGIVPLVPGLTLYKGLLQIIESSRVGQSIDSGIYTLLTALLIALAIASGAAFGYMIARPIRRTLVIARNVLPTHRLHR